MRLRTLLRTGTAVLVATALAAPAARASLAPQLADVDPRLTAAMAATPAKVGVIAQFASAPTEADSRAMRRAGFLPGMVRYSIVDAIYAEGPASAVAQLTRNPRVTTLEHDAVIPWALDKATIASRTRPVWDATYSLNGETMTGGFTGRGVGIAIVDTGVDARNPDLMWKPLGEAVGMPVKTVANYKVLGRPQTGLFGTPPDAIVEANTLAVDVVNSDNTGGHGTHVAGIAAGLGANDARYKGAAPGANIIGYGAGETLAVHMALAAFDHIHHNHESLNIRVVNNSWGGPGDWMKDAAVTKAAQRLVNEDGITVVFAAGNSGGSGADIQTNIWGNIPEVIQVANYHETRGWLDDSSSRGLKTREDTWPDLAASGTQIISTAATAGPVTYYGSAQDWAISRLFNYGEPLVVPAPVPGQPLRVDRAGQKVWVGDYASMTGTSMAAPLVAGIVAVILEANPALTPFQVRDILRATANRPTGRTYANDGFAIGRGVADTAEAVAVALRMREGMTLDEALANASLTLSEPAELNLGTAPVTNNVVPLQPAPGSLVTGNAQIFNADTADTSLFTGDNHVLPGEPVGLSVRNVQSSNSDVAPVSKDNITAIYEIRRNGALVYGPFTPSITEGKLVDGSSAGITYSYSWDVPKDAPVGSYTFESVTTILSTGNSYRSTVLPFNVVAAG